MKNLSKLSRHSDWGILALRVAVGVIFLYHGVDKWQLWSNPPTGMSPDILTLIKFLSIVEPLGGIALITGYFLRWAAAGLGLIMVGAILMKARLWGVPFSVPMGVIGVGWEYDLVLLASNVALVFLGAGKWSLHCDCGEKHS